MFDFLERFGFGSGRHHGWGHWRRFWRHAGLRPPFFRRRPQHNGEADAEIDLRISDKGYRRGLTLPGGDQDHGPDRGSP